MAPGFIKVSWAFAKLSKTDVDDRDNKNGTCTCTYMRVCAYECVYRKIFVMKQRCYIENTNIHTRMLYTNMGAQKILLRGV